ncbi:MAG: TIGR04190 family B12-binding domain/radical SAM domain protein [Thermoproteota archaeon]|nr:MAG: TIGR04190 family B12-binding domain/radical SAM domain protein [Candidatus Korarchaeota archaeon]RLG56122.1 MAG: TIGR04190 family B12-binding domain/radical SAM domain protein [Candidatus Korarchaeota archaeon]
MRVDVALIHPPSVYDFRELPSYAGPISEVVPSLYVFDMYPYGFLTISTYLEEAGFKVGIFNIAAKMLADRKFSPPKFLKKLNAEVYAISLHWLVHAHGALELAKIIRKLHPESTVVLGGFSATYYWQEIMSQHPYVDIVVRGDSTEEVMRQLAERISQHRSLEGVPNVAWRDGNKVRAEPISHVPSDFNNRVDHWIVAKNLLRTRDMDLTSPFYGFKEKPVTAVITVKGCIFNCITCGGSASAFKCYLNRSRVALKSPDKIAEEAESIASMISAPIFFVGDLRIGGEERALAVAKALREADLGNELFFELFYPASRKILQEIRRIGDSIYLHISPESPIEEVRRAFGRPYGNSELEKTVKNAVSLGFKRIDLYFMVGLPLQKPSHADKPAKYLLYITKEATARGRIDSFVAPLAPFVDPGSLAFEDPDSYGYAILWRSLACHRRALTELHWKQILNYRTSWMSREEIAESSARAIEEMAKAKLSLGLISREQYELTLRRIELDRKISELASSQARREDLAAAVRELVETEYRATEDLYPSRSLAKSLRLPLHLKLLAKLLIK